MFVGVVFVVVDDGGGVCVGLVAVVVFVVVVVVVVVVEVVESIGWSGRA